ncbi:hypothetical protein BD289DRAFT_436368 [Coniella lustricola]|uniref:GYF domain-containing protein n=1 Tax=Coniella lustricola TaxID=2025994 RepID=A0A2T3A5B3_9PEZI|nr:hypothetical protein BD289DRAFT_436368 [Coniella lustricola]
MTSRFSAARPKRAGEAFARAHHGETSHSSNNTATASSHDGSSAYKRVKFDVRNPSALAPDAPGGADEDDEEEQENAAVLEADVIGKGAGGTKRGAVNIDGYDSDSDNETFKDRAAARKSHGKRTGAGDGRGQNDMDVADVDIDIADQLDNYDKHLRNGGAEESKTNDDDDEDMFAADDDPDEEDTNDPAAPSTTSRAAARRTKEVRFLDADKIEGQEQASKSGGTVRLDDGHVSSDDEEDLELAIQEEGIDEEVGLGGLKRNAPKIDAFNMRAEQEEGAFDESGTFIRKAVDPDAIHDKWLDGVSKKDMKKAAEAHEKREAEMRRLRREDDSMQTEDLLKSLILSLDRGETPIEALARLGKGRAKEKKVPKWKLKKQHKVSEEDSMNVDHAKEPEDAQQTKLKEAINSITEAADKLLGREYIDIYETEREMLIRDWQTEAGERWKEPEAGPVEVQPAASSAGKMWEYRWIDGRDGGVVQGPYDGPTMKAWQDAGYFDGVEFRNAGQDEWSRIAEFV